MFSSTIKAKRNGDDIKMKVKKTVLNAKVAMLSTTLLLSGMQGFSVLANPVTNEAINLAYTNTGNDDWIHAEGSRLYDMQGNEVWMTGANWFGFNCTENVLHGLWSAELETTLKSIADHGINLLRVPVSTELLYSWMTGVPADNINVNWYANPQLVKADGTNMNSMEVFDQLMMLCKKYGIKVMVDVHSPDANNSGHVYPLWYGTKMKDGTVITTDMWIDTWVWLVDKYKNDDTLIAVDLENEPHGKRGYTKEEPDNFAKWDNTTDENNWRYAAERCANAILAVNPNILIVIEGIEDTPQEGYTYADPDVWQSSDVYNGGWWGGNLRRAKDYPIDLGEHQSQLVYSPHDYGPLVFAQEWFNKDFTEQTLLDDYWYESWAYLEQENIAPLLMGEWGGTLDGGDNEKWLNILANYMINHRINHTFWCINPNSGDTGGLLYYDFATWDAVKYNIMEPTLWQDEAGKYIGLDHQIPLGSNGITVSEHYGSAPVEKVPVSEIKLSVEVAELKIGDRLELQTTVLPSNAANKAVNYTSSNTSVATVSKDGVVTAKNTGSATITVTSVDGNKTAQCNVTVTKDEVEIAVTGVTLDQSQIEMIVGDSTTLTATVLPSDATNKAVTFSSSNTSVATVDLKGKVTAIGEGSTMITVITTDGNKKATCKVTVEKKNTTVEVTGVTLDKSKLEMLVGDNATLTATVLPSDATNKAVTFSSSNTSVATVDLKGKVTAIGEGSAMITVITTDGNKKATCAVTVTKKEETGTEVPVSGISLSDYYVETSVGTTHGVTATVTPSNATNKDINWTSTNTSIATVSSSGVITAVGKGNVTIAATTVDGSYKANINVNVKAEGIAVNSMWLNTYWLQMKPGDTHQIIAYFSPTNATNKNITLVSSDKKVIQVSADGVITAVGEGMATVTTTSVDGNIKVVTQFVVSK